MNDYESLQFPNLTFSLIAVNFKMKKMAERFVSIKWWTEDGSHGRNYGFSVEKVSLNC
jgi:hypothetical protein